MFAFKVIVFIKVFSLVTPMGADLNQFFGAVLFRDVYPEVKWCTVHHHIIRSLLTVHFEHDHRILFTVSWKHFRRITFRTFEASTANLMFLSVSQCKLNISLPFAYLQRLTLHQHKSLCSWTMIKQRKLQACYFRIVCRFPLRSAP